jgi:hypothetical protein
MYWCYWYSGKPYLELINSANAGERWAQGEVEQVKIRGIL